MKKNAIITGATGAIGKAIARQMAGHGFKVTIIARDETKARKVVEEIIASTGNQDVNFLIADLSSKSEIIKLAEEVENEALKSQQGPKDIKSKGMRLETSNIHEVLEKIQSIIPQKKHVDKFFAKDGKLLK